MSLSSRSVAPLLVLCVGATACRNETESQGPARPELACRAPRHDFGAPVEGERLRHVFQLENRGRAPLRVLSVEKSYSCVAKDPPKRIEPGARAALEVECDTELRPGKMADDIVVHTNDPRSPELKLELAARVEPLLALEPPEVVFEPRFGETQGRELRLVGKLAASAHLALLENEDPSARVELLPPEPLRSAGVRVTLTAARVETRISHLRLSTGLAKPEELRVSITWKVSSNLRIEPSNPYFNLREPPPHERVVRVSSARDDFTLHAIEVREGPFEASFTRDEAARAYTVTVRVQDGKVPPGERGVLGQLLIASNDPAEPRKLVPLFALGILAGDSPQRGVSTTPSDRPTYPP